MGNISKIRIQNTDYTIKDSRLPDGTSSQFVKGDGSLDSTSYLQTGVIQPTNPFSGDSSKFYLEPVMDCMYEANRRWVVEGIITDSSTSPATETSLTTTEKNGLFGGDYGRVGVYLGANKTLKLTIKAAADPDTATLAVYGYGRIILNFYNYGLPLSVSGRLYYGSPSGTKSWTTFSFSTTRGGLNGIYVGNYFSVNYPRAIELTIAGQAVTNDPRSTNLSSVEWWISRASISQYPILTKYAIAQRMYGNLTAPKFITSGGTSSQFVKGDGTLDSASYAPLASPALTGTPTAPTATSGTNTTQIATTEFVQNALPKSVATYNITLGATPSEGWYRVAKLGHSFSGIVYMMGTYASARPTVATFAISGKAINVGCDIIQLSGTAESGGISKVRLVSDENDDDVFYFDIYKAVSSNVSTTYLTFNGIFANLADATSTTVLNTASTYVRKVCNIKTITEDMYVTTSTFNDTVGDIETLLAAI